MWGPLLKPLRAVGALCLGLCPSGLGWSAQEAVQTWACPPPPARSLVQSRGCHLDETPFGPAGALRFRSKASCAVPVLSCEAFLRISMREDLKPAAGEPPRATTQFLPVRSLAGLAPASPVYPPGFLSFPPGPPASRATPFLAWAPSRPLPAWPHSCRRLQDSQVWFQENV